MALHGYPEAGLALGLVLLVVISGCSSLLGDEPTSTIEWHTSSTTPQSTITDQNPQTNTDPPRDSNVVIHGEGDLPFNASQVYLRVQHIMGLEGDPVSLQIVKPQEREPREFSDFERRVGFVHPNTSIHSVSGVASGNSILLIIPDNASADEIERVLAHELAHVVFSDNDLVIQPHSWENYSQTYDHDNTRRAVFEGVATYVAAVYAERYLDDSNPFQVEKQEYDSGTSRVKYQWGAYYFGARYIDHFSGSPRNISGVINNAPWTTEQVIHNYSPDSEKPVPIHVDGEVPPQWEEKTKPNTYGELFIRVVLDRYLNDSQVDRAATGWGNDKLLTYETQSDISYIWILRWDTPTDADEFETAWRTFLDHHGSQANHDSWSSNGTWYRIERLDPDTVVIYIGNQSFVNESSVKNNRIESPVSSPRILASPQTVVSSL